jgi:ferredoxin
MTTENEVLADGYRLWIKRRGMAAAESGDIEGAAICVKAIGHCYERYDLTPAERARVDAMTVEQCRRCVAAWASGAAAQIDE